MSIQDKMTAYTWYDEDKELLIDARRVVEVTKSKVTDVARIEYLKNGINLYFSTGKGSFKVTFSKSGRTMHHKGSVTVETPIGSKQVEVDVSYQAHDNPISLPVISDIFEAIKNGNLSYIKSYNGDLNSKDDDGLTLLMKACRELFPDVVEYLVSKGVDINVENDRGGSALSISVAEGSAANVLTLLNAGATSDDRFNRIVHRALMDGNNEILKLLIEKDVDYSGRNSDGDSVLESATAYLGDSLFSKTENLEAVRHLVEKVKIDVNTKNESNGNTAIFSAAESGSINVMKYLIKNGAKLNELNNKGSNALLSAIRLKKHTVLDGVPLLDHDDFFETIKFLIDSGIDVSLVDEDGKSAYELIKLGDASRLLKYLPEPKIVTKEEEKPEEVGVRKLEKTPPESECELVDMAMLQYNNPEEKDALAKEITIYKGGDSYLLDPDNIPSPRDNGKKWMSPVKIFKCKA